MTGRELYFRLLGYVKPYWKIYLFSVLMMAATAATEPFFPALMKPMLDGSFVDKDPNTMFWVPWLIVLLFLVRGITGFFSSYAGSWVSNKLVTDLRDQMFRRLLMLPTRYYDDHASGNLISKIAFDVSQVTSAATTVVTVLVRESVTIVGLLGWLLYLNWKLTLISLTVAPAIMLIIRVVSKRLRHIARDAQRSMGDVTHVLEESIECQRVVKVFGGQEYEAARFYDSINRLRQFNMKHTAASAANVPLVQWLAAIALAVIVYMATQQAAQDKTTVGGFVSFIIAMLMLLSPIKALTSVNEHLQKGLAAAESVFELLDEDTEQDAGKQQLARAGGHIEFRDVSFSYGEDGRQALAQIALTIRPGETIALVGPSGGGKTTLVNLLPRFYNPTQGQILLDGIDTQSLTLASLRANIALVSQDVVLFNDSVAANIAYGKLAETSRAAIEAAADAAYASDFIRDMAQGFDTLIGENGVRLSGGQRQRLAIARALLKNAPILILDEATSALDTEAERQVQAALERLMQGRTTLIIAHRLSTIEKADRIVVMQKGRIAEIGSHSQLLAQDGIYANLHRIQFAQERGGAS